MAQINKPSEYFNTVLYTGDGSASRDITGVGFQPDFTWIKERSGNLSHVLGNSVSGDNKFLATNGTGVESTDSTKFRTFVSDGFQVGSHGGVNGNTDTYVGWSWLAGGTASSNTDGSITSNVSANTTSGFSIVSFDLTSLTGNQTVGHGLGTAPKVVITKRRSGGAGDWTSYFGAIGNSYLVLNSTGASATNANFMNNTAPTSSVFTVGDPTWWAQSPFIAYCFAEKKGFSKFGKFTSNGSDDGTFTYCGFKPAWVMMKANVSDAWSHWYIFDNKRDTYNLADLPQYANLAIQDGYYGGTPATNYSQIDMLSNGFKMRRDGNWGLGGNGTEVIYMAFAENPLVGTNNTPATAR